MKSKLTLLVATILILFSCSQSLKSEKKATVSTPADSIMNDTTRLARDLVSGKYGRFFVYPSQDQAIEAIWKNPVNHEILYAIVKDSSQNPLARLLVCEILYAKEFTFVSKVEAKTVAAIYANALSGKLTPSANSWGFLYELDDAGEVGRRFLSLGKNAIPALLPLLGNSQPGPMYEGSKEATVGNGYKYRIKDFAAFYLGKIIGYKMSYFENYPDRDRQIEELKKAISSRQ